MRFIKESFVVVTGAVAWGFWKLIHENERAFCAWETVLSYLDQGIEEDFAQMRAESQRRS